MALVLGARASAQIIIQPGLDHLVTTTPTDISFGLDQIPAIPAGFFGPGCDPFVGTVALQGVPLDPLTWHLTDTVIQRPNPFFLNVPPANVNVPIEMIQMSLVSTQPITVTCGTGQTQWDVRVIESPTQISNGTMNVTHDPPGNQGRITTCTINARVDISFSPAGGGPSLLLPPLPGPIVMQSVAFYQWKTTPFTFAYPGSGPNFFMGNGPYLLRNLNDARHTIEPPPPPPDYHETYVPDDLSQDDTEVHFGTTPGGYPPIPPGFFDPGSDPFFGIIVLRGLQIDVDQYGNTDTIVQRAADPVQPVDPPGTMGTVPIEIVALNLVSVEPIVVSNAGNLELWNVQVGLSQTPAPQGSLSATKTHLNGGTFSATLPVLPKLVFTRTTDGAVRELDAGLFGLQPLEFSLPAGNFVHFLDPNMSNMFYHHPQARFHTAILEQVPGDPTSQIAESPTLTAPEGPARHRIGPPKRTPRVCIYRVLCADGACDQCPLCTGDVCQGFRCPNLTCSTGFSSTCGPDCCLEFTLITCDPPSGQPFCPIKQPCLCDPTPGACCDETTGVCTVVPECECQGTYLGDGTVCGPTGACCLPDGSCVEIDAQCCQLMGGTFEGGTCDPPLGCCLPNGTCQDMDPQCCILAGGIVKPGLCAPPVACCLPGAGGCVMLDPDCCILQGGQLDPSGVCDPVRECCLPGGACVDMDPDCCTLAGGQPGAGICDPPQRCCIAGGCMNTDPQCCQLAGGTPGPGVCGPPFECCLGPACVNDDQFCCQLNGGVPGLGFCGPIVQCCLGGNCIETDPNCCQNAGGTPGLDDCDPVQRCCLPDGSCQAGLEPDCCVIDLNGIPNGAGACFPPQACCLPDGSCDDQDPGCCIANGGTPQGPGTGCTAVRACCLPNGTCAMRDPLCCINSGGTPQAAGSQCAPQMQACCLPNGGCVNRDPVCCDEANGTIAGGVCQGDVAPPDGIDDACDGGGGPNPPNTCPAPHDRRKNRYICFDPELTVQQIAYRVDKITAPTGICWVGAPDANNRSQCVDAPVFRFWPEPYIEVGDCEIIPVADYQVRGTVDGFTMGGPFNVGTILLPSLNLKLWGDTVGVNNGIEWTPPNQFTNVQDVLAILAFISAAPIRPIFEVANLQAISSPDSCLNPFVNTADVLIEVRAIAGDSYGPPSTGKIVDPNNCPLCP